MEVLDVLLVGLAGALFGAAIGSSVAHWLRSRRADRETASSRLKHASELRRLRRDLSALREQLRGFDERGRLDRIESNRYRSEIDSLRAQLARREQDLRIFQETGRKASTDASTLASGLAQKESEIARLRALVEHRDRELSALEHSRSGLEREKAQIETTERDLRAMVRALEKVGHDLKGRVEDRDRALAQQETIIHGLERLVEEHEARLAAVQERIDESCAQDESERDESLEITVRKEPVEEPQEPVEAVVAIPAIVPAEEPPTVVEALEPSPTEPVVTLGREIASEGIDSPTSPASNENPPLTPGLIPSLGPSGIQRLAKIGISDASSLATADPQILEESFPKRDHSKIRSWIDAAKALTSDREPAAPNRGSRRGSGRQKRADGRQNKKKQQEIPLEPAQTSLEDRERSES